MREMKEGRNLPTLLSSPLIKIIVFNWSKLILFLYFSFFFWLCGFLALCSFVESLLLVNTRLIYREGFSLDFPGGTHAIADITVAIGLFVEFG